MNRTCEQRVALRLMDLHPGCERFAVIVFGYIIPFLAIVVTSVNVLIVIVFMRPHVKSHTTFILTLIACADILDIICPTAVLAYQYLLGYYKEFLSCKQMELTNIFGKICVDMFNMLSLWLTVLLAHIRFKCIKSPVIARDVHSFKRIVLYILAILILVTSVHLPSFFIFDFKSVETFDSSKNITMVMCGFSEPDGIFLKSCSRRKVIVFVETLLDSLIPCVILVYYNTMMFITLQRAKRSRSSLRHSNSSAHGNSTKKNRRIHSRYFRRLFHSYPVNREITGDIEHPGCNLLRFFCCCRYCHPCAETATAGISTPTDPVFDKLDRECQRTSWLILVVSTVIVVHEIPIAVANTYALATHTNAPLPISIKGCFSITLLLWQFVTYPLIFLIYACMSSAFRTELWKILTCLCKPQRPNQPKESAMFLSPCSVRKTTSQDKEAGPSNVIELNQCKISDSDGSVDDVCEFQMKTLRL